MPRGFAEALCFEDFGIPGVNPARHDVLRPILPGSGPNLHEIQVCPSRTTTVHHRKTGRLYAAS